MLLATSLIGIELVADGHPETLMFASVKFVQHAGNRN
jgi:hypothetical protein